MAGSGSGNPRENSQAVFALPEKFTIAQSDACFQRLMAQVEQGCDIDLDGGAVERIDAAGIQLLLVVQQVLMEARHAMRWVRVSEVLRESVTLLGLAERLDLPDE